MAYVISDPPQTLNWSYFQMIIVNDHIQKSICNFSLTLYANSITKTLTVNFEWKVGNELWIMDNANWMMENGQWILVINKGKLLMEND